MYRKNMCKIFKYLFIFVLFFNTLFFGINEAMALAKEGAVGAKDRVRSFRKGEIMFSFNKDTGFSCEVSGLKIYPNRDDYKSYSDNIVENFFTNAGQDIAAYLTSIAFDVFLRPLFCVLFMRGLEDSAANSELANKLGDEGVATSGSRFGAGIIGTLEMAAAIIGVNLISELQDLILGEDDYNVDPTNKYCIGYVISDFVTCLINLIIWSLEDLSTSVKMFIILSLNVSYYVIKMGVIGGVFFPRAQQAFSQLSLCGDDWNVYGSDTLYEKYKYKNPTNTPFSIADIWDGYPTKGAFFGSRQYLLDNCFQNRDEQSCKSLFSNVLKSDTVISETTFNNLSNVIQKPYREYKYGGVEYSYSGCKDPRPERIGYLGTSNKEDQLYYFRGNEAANFACDRFLIKNTQEYRDAYSCCLNASQKFVCVVNKIGTKENHVMCEKGKNNCKIKSGIDFEIKGGSTAISCDDIKKSLDGLPDENMTTEGKNSIYNEFCNKDGSFKETYKFKEENTVTTGDGDTIVLKVSKSSYEEDRYCVETYNLCPYNFRIKGGTEIFGNEFQTIQGQNIKVEETKDGSEVYKQKTSFNEIIEDNNFRNCVFTKNGEKNCNGACYSRIDNSTEEFFECYGRASNFCQLGRHCVKIPTISNIIKPDTNVYVDESCINLVGSSHNFDNYNQVVERTNTSFFLSAPVVECITETAKNILMNKAGHTKCVEITEIPVNNKCNAGGAVYEKGESLDETKYQAPAFKLRQYFFNIVKLMLALAVVLYGYSALIARKGFSSVEDVLKFILTLTFISYFATSTNWIRPTFNFFYVAFNEVAELSLKLATDEADYENPKYSGCYFLESKYINNNYSEYGDRKYIAVFDTLDCKLARYFGYYLNASVNPPILSLLITAVFTFGIGILLILPLLILFIGLLYFVINVTLVFITASFTITILLLLSPIMIPLYLFERTKDYTIKWIKVILRNVFTPMFLIIGMFLFFTFFDKYFIGDAVFIGTDEPLRNAYCGKICKINDNNFYYLPRDDANQENNCRDTSRGKVIDLSESTLICVFQNATKKAKPIGIGILNFLVADFVGFPGLYTQMGGFFSCFLDIVFLLILIFIFNKFIPFIEELTETIFGIGSGRKSNVDSNIGLSLKNMINSVVKIGAGFANKAKNYGGKMLVDTISNKIADRVKAATKKQDGSSSGDGGSSERKDTDSKEEEEESKIGTKSNKIEL